MIQRPVLYYISAHGYGHGVRSCDVIRAFHALRPQIPVIVVSQLPEEFFRSRLVSDRVSFRQAGFDVGLVQRDAVQADTAATFKVVMALYKRKKHIIEEEKAFLRSCGAGIVVSDIPGMPFEAAAALGIPRIGVGNLSWDWIYQPFAEQDTRWWRIIRQLEAEYAQADLLLRLPFHGSMNAFPRIEDVPLVGRSGRSRRSEIASAVGLENIGRKWILLSFTALQWQSDALDRLGTLRGYEFFAVKPAEWHGANIHTLDTQRFPFRDIVASVDAVVSKPGYGIVSDCILNRKPLVYTERSGFIEYDILVEAIRRHLRAAFISAEDLYRGELGQALDSLWTRPAPKKTIGCGGDRIIARRIAHYHSGEE